MAGKQITDREKEIVVQQYQDGWALRKIASYANLSQTTVMKIVKEAGIELRGNKTYNTQKREKVQSLYQAGMSILNIMKETGIRSEQTIYTMIQANRRNRHRNVK